MDNLHDTHTMLLHKSPRGEEPCYSLPFSLSFCDNESELTRDFYYGGPLDPTESVKNWIGIIRFVREQQPRARIIFYCAHACTFVDEPDRYARTLRFHALLAPLARVLDITVVPPFELPPELTRMPEDRDHFDMRIYRAMAGHIVLCHLARLSNVAEPYARVEPL
jgi:hypothetical protein